MATLDRGYPKDHLYRILSLDGGGSKGFYMLGVLREIEGLLGCHLYKRFDLIFGTSTGSIIAALLRSENQSTKFTSFIKHMCPVSCVSAPRNKKRTP
jgi:patatin-like phospholipase/acyl hydrolase